MESSDCTDICMLCNQYMAYFVNNSKLHGVCKNCSYNLQKPKQSCIHCDSLISILHLSNVPSRWINSNYTNPLAFKPKTENNIYSYNDPYNTRTFYNSAVLCCLCKKNSEARVGCKNHSVCKNCFNEFPNQCFFCSCQSCGLHSPHFKLDCGHPVCSACSQENVCKICKKTCFYCEKPSTFRIIKCPTHFACEECYYSFAKNFADCGICTNKALAYKCKGCKKYFNELFPLGETESKYCKECFNDSNKLKIIKCETCKNNYDLSQVEKLPCIHYLCKNCSQAVCSSCGSEKEYKNCTTCSGILADDDNKNFLCKDCKVNQKPGLCLLCNEKKSFVDSGCCHLYCENC